jgi:hypothetical protein
VGSGELCGQTDQEEGSEQVEYSQGRKYCEADLAVSQAVRVTLKRHLPSASSLMKKANKDHLSSSRSL